jgi:hypothetical protein
MLFLLLYTVARIVDTKTSAKSVPARALARPGNKYFRDGMREVRGTEQRSLQVHHKVVLARGPDLSAWFTPEMAAPGLAFSALARLSAAVWRSGLK